MKELPHIFTWCSSIISNITCIDNIRTESYLLEAVDYGKLKTELCLATDALVRNEGLLLQAASVKKHVSGQWSGICNITSVSNLKVLKLTITAEKVALMPNSQTGCEQSNSKYNRAKDKLGNKISVDMIKARMRVGSNGPLVHMFNPVPVREYWIQDQHKVTEN